MSLGTFARREQLASEVEHDLVGRTEEPFERHGALEVPVERMVGREPDAGEHLLTLRGHGPPGSPGDGLGERRGDRSALVPRRGQARLERFDRDEGFGEPVAHRLELGD